MQISLNWIRQFCPFETTESPREIGARFSLHTAEVEHWSIRGSNLSQILVAAVLGVKPHPNADRLTVVEVDIGRGEKRDVVCGAPNVRPGILVPYAAPGIVVDGHEIRETKVRGVLSQGMLCSEKELELSVDSTGLWELPPDALAGTPIATLRPDLRDVILEVDNKSLTHRPDLWGHHGIAREFSAIYHAPLLALKADDGLANSRGQSQIRVSVEGKGVGGRDGFCRRYCGLQIDGVRVSPSPDWLRHRLAFIGARSVNNIVDVTNYILFELGQPLHAFDTQRIEGAEVRVRRAHQGEELDLLDGQEVKLDHEDLVIADARSAIALAGVMGGAGSQITESTTSIFLESANFAPARVRRASVRVGKRTDSSLRFEKSLDPENARTGILRAARMVLDLCPEAKVIGPLKDLAHEPAQTIEISTSAAILTRRLGAEIEAMEVRATLDRLGFLVRGDTGGEWKVRVPSWRATKDVSMREDLVEEIGRIHGYDQIKPFAPEWTCDSPRVNEHRRLERTAKEFLALHCGMSEIFTYSLVGAAHCQRFGLDPQSHLKLKNPMSEDMDRLRQEIAPMHLEKAVENQRYARSFGFFELGRVYRKKKDRRQASDLPDERSHLAGCISFEKKIPENFYTVRHFVLSLLERLRVADAQVVPPSEASIKPWAHPGVHARVRLRSKDCGQIYRVHPAIEAILGLEGDVILFDLDFDALFESRQREIIYQSPLKYPTVPFDVAVIAPERVPVSEIQEKIEKAAGKLLLSAEVFDVFHGEQSGQGQKSVAFHLIFGALDRTLSGEERKEIEERVMEALKSSGFPLRQ